MNVSLETQGEIKKVITSRLTGYTMDQLACILSSNCCEDYFDVLVTFPEGKRLTKNQTNSWRILQEFVAGMRSNVQFTN